MRTIVNGRSGARLLVSGAFLFMALGSLAVGGAAAAGSDSRLVAGASTADLPHVTVGELRAPSHLLPCSAPFAAKPKLWDKIFDPNCLG